MSEPPWRFDLPVSPEDYTVGQVISREGTNYEVRDHLQTSTGGRYLIVTELGDVFTSMVPEAEVRDDPQEKWDSVTFTDAADARKQAYTEDDASGTPTAESTPFGPGTVEPARVQGTQDQPDPTNPPPASEPDAQGTGQEPESPSQFTTEQSGASDSETGAGTTPAGSPGDTGGTEGTDSPDTATGSPTAEPAGTTTGDTPTTTEGAQQGGTTPNT